MKKIYKVNIKSVFRASNKKTRENERKQKKIKENEL